MKEFDMEKLRKLTPDEVNDILEETKASLSYMKWSIAWGSFSLIISIVNIISVIVDPHMVRFIGLFIFSILADQVGRYFKNKADEMTEHHKAYEIYEED